MGDHYSNIYEQQRKHEEKSLRKDIKQQINKMDKEDLQLLNEIVSEFNLYKSFFEAIKHIGKTEF